LQQVTGTLGRAKRGHLQRAQRAPYSERSERPVPRRQAARDIYATPLYVVSPLLDDVVFMQHHYMLGGGERESS